MFKNFEFYNSMQMYLSSMIKKGGPSKTKNRGKKKLVGSKTLIEVQLRKPWQLNWKHEELSTLINVKRDEHIAFLDKVDP